MKHVHRLTWSLFAVALLLLLAACGPTVNKLKVQQTVVVSKSFQEQPSPFATAPTYRCGAWSSNNAPGTYSTINIYAKLTKAITGVSGASAKATVHFQNNDVTLDPQTSDSGGYVVFALPLQGRQPRMIPATVDVTFTVGATTVNCSHAFFTPQ